MDRRLLRIALLCFIMAAALCAGATAADKSGDGFTRLELNGATAYAAYHCDASAQIVVAVYQEDSGKLCALGVKEASAGAGDVTIQVDGDIPEHFTAKAFLLDSAFAPLCAACPIPFEAENDAAVLRGTTNYYANACIDKGVLYYTFLPEPKIYAYNGSDTVSFAAGGTPMNLIACDGVLYYLNHDNGAIYILDLDTGTRKILYNREEVYDFVIRGNEMFIKTQGVLSMMDLTTKRIQEIYRAEDQYTIQREKYFVYFNYPAAMGTSAQTLLGYRRPYDLSGCEPVYGTEQILLARCKSASVGAGQDLIIQEVNPDSGETREIGRIESETGHYFRSTLLYPARYVEAGDNIYFALTWFIKNQSSEFVKSDVTYYKLNLPSETITVCTAEEYLATWGQWIFDDSVRKYNYSYTGNNHVIKGISPVTGVEETLMRSSQNLLPAAQSGGKVILFECANSTQKVTSSLSNLNWYSSATLYMMDIDGNNPIELASYSSATGTESGTGQAFIESSSIGTRTCHICNGAGSVECLYCHGSGFGWHTTLGVGGGSSFGACPSCGGTGKNICKICWGAGVIVT